MKLIQFVCSQLQCNQIDRGARTVPREAVLKLPLQKAMFWFCILILEVVGRPVLGREVRLPPPEAPLGVRLRQQLPQPPLVRHGRPQVGTTLFLVL